MKWLFIILFFLNVNLEKEANISNPFSFGPLYKLERKYYISELIGHHDGYFYILKKKRKSSEIVVLDKFSENNLTLVSSKEFKLPRVKDEKTGLREVYIFGGKIVFFVTRYDRDEKISYAYNCSVDLDLNEMSELKEIDKVEIKNSRQSPGFNFILSKDEKKILVQHNFPFEKYNNEKFSYIVYDTTFSVIWKKEIELPYKDKIFKVNDYILDDSTNIHLLSQISPEPEKGDQNLKGVPNNNYLIISYFPKENKIKEMDINLSNKWVSSVTLDIAPTGDLVAGGFYSNTQYFSIAGTFYLRIDDSTRNITAQGLKAFEKDFMMEFLPERKVKKGKELSDFYFDHFVLREDGSALLVAEQYYMITNYYWDPYLYTYNYTYQYYYNDIILVSIAADGTIQWNKKIPKRQLSSNDDGFYSSYAFGTNGTDAVIVYNDHPDNVAKIKGGQESERTMTKPWKAQATYVKVDKDGNLTYQSLFPASKDNLILRPKVYFQTNSSSLILMGMKGSNYRFGKLSF